MLHTKIEQFSSLNVIGLPQYSSHNSSKLHRLVTPAQIAEGKKVVEPAEISIKEEEDEVYFLDQEYSGLYDDKVWNYSEYYLNLPYVVPMEITFMDTEDEYYKYGTLGPLRYIHSNLFRFRISSLGSPTFFLRIAKRER
jgi:hypothetical protein